VEASRKSMPPICPVDGKLGELEGSLAMQGQALVYFGGVPRERAPPVDCAAYDDDGSEHGRHRRDRD